MEFRLFSENCIFRPRRMKITITKYTLLKNTVKVPCNDMLIFFHDVYVRHNYLFNFRQKVQVFSDLYFCIDVMMEMGREDNLTTYFGST